LGLNWVLKDGILHYTAYPWFRYIAEHNKENYPLELIKNSTSTGNTDAKSSQKSKWYNTVHKVRTSILQYWEKLYFPEFH
jgi:hypothetical protein